MSARGPSAHGWTARFAAAATIAAALVACAKQSAVIGQSTAREAMSDDGVDAGAAPIAPSASAEEWRAGTTRVTGHRFVSKGHAGGRWEASIAVNEAARQAMDAGAGAFPVGTRFVEEHFEKDGGGPLMGMEKRAAGYDPDHGDWRYTTLSAAGAVAADGPAASCRECHDQAARDHVFPFPSE